MLRSRRPTLRLLGLALALLAGGCGGESATTTAADDAEGVVFGSGELPETIPAEFALPAGSSVGSTMVVSSTGFTEVVVRVGADPAITMRFFVQELAEAGFNVDGSSDEDGISLIQFSAADAKGTIDITEPQPGISQAVVRYNVP